MGTITADGSPRSPKAAVVGESLGLWLHKLRGILWQSPRINPTLGGASELQISKITGILKKLVIGSNEQKMQDRKAQHRSCSGWPFLHDKTVLCENWKGEPRVCEHSCNRWATEHVNIILYAQNYCEWGTWRCSVGEWNQWVVTKSFVLLYMKRWLGVVIRRFVLLYVKRWLVSH